MIRNRIARMGAVLTALSMVLVFLVGIAAPSSAQSATATPTQSSDDFQVVLTITGVVKSVTADTLILADNLTILIPQGVVVPAGIVPGTTITVTVQTITDDFVAISISVGTSTATPSSTPTVGSTAVATVVSTIEPTEESTDESTEIETAVATSTDTPTGTLITATPTTAIPTITPVGIVTLTPTGTLAAIGTVTSIACDSGNIQPVAQRIATFFHVSYAEIMNWHCEGFGFGEIAKAYALALSTVGSAHPETAAQIFALRKSGLGWGQIMKMFNVSARDLAPGIAIRGGNGNGNNDNGENDDSNGKPPKDKGHGNGNGNKNK